MGFYHRSSLVQDAQRHGVKVRSVDVCLSSREATLESPVHGNQPAVRLGLNNVKGLQDEAARRIEEARAVKAFESPVDLASRVRLDVGHMGALASVNALESLSGNRRQAMWQAAASVPDKGLLRPAEIVEDLVEIESPTELESVVADYRYLGLTLGRHPLSFLRERLSKRRLIPSDVLDGFSNGQLARGCGIVTVRQRPGTANGVVFITLKDEMANVNVICWPNLAEQFRREVMGAQLLGIYGIWQSESNVRHLVAQRLVDLSHFFGELDMRSRDFR